MITNMKQLEKVVNQKIIQAMEATKDIIYNDLKVWIELYYSEYDPIQYDRTDKMMSSFKSTDIISNGNGYEFKVGFDDDYLSFTYRGNSKEPKSEYNGITGLSVLQAMESGTHGWTAYAQGSTHAHWTEGLESLNDKYGSIENLFTYQLKKVGLNVI